MSFEINALLYKSDSDSSIRVCTHRSLRINFFARLLSKTLNDHQTHHRFHVRSLGWTIIDENELTNGNSSRTVNRCIHELTHSIDDNMNRWGDGKDLYMDLNQRDILFIDPIELIIVHQQSVAAIRVWGVGRENSRLKKKASNSIERCTIVTLNMFLSRDFAYVAKDKDRTAKIYKCHVFRCENTSARIVANTLKDICRNLMIERGLLNTDASADESSSVLSTQQR
jgi:amyloid beta A4 precursor protein-binding family B member 2